MIRYRPEIDGLRAVAVAPVILFHAGFQLFHGGFVGVDVFFVISGYLITSIIAAELAEQNFSVLRFYQRRARRILPALFCVIAVCLPLAALWVIPEERHRFAQSVAAVAVFGSNILFWRESGYFDSTAELKPLLHTWSLAVEEQYYVLFPLLLMAVWRFGKRWTMPLVVVGVAASLALAQWLVVRNPSAAFFLLPTRAWELLLGAFLALWVPRFAPFVSEVGSVVGLVAILVAVFAFDKFTPTPSLYTLLPALGTAILIACAGPQNMVGRMLASPPIVGLGLISYSAYLWHQPLLAFTRMRSIGEPTPVLLGIICAGALAAAYLTWRFVETPFRRGLAGRHILTMAAVGSVAFLGIGVLAAVSTGGKEPSSPTNGRCNVGAGDCFALKGAPMQVVLWGDSYADALAPSLAKVLGREGISLRLFVANSCPSILGVSRNEPGVHGLRFASECTQRNEQAMRDIRKEHTDVVVLTSAYEAWLFEKNGRGEPLLVDPARPGAAPVAFLADRLRETIKATGTRVILVSPHPTVDDFKSKRKALYFGQADQIYADYAAASRARAAILSKLDGVPFEEIDGRDLFCQGSSCPVASGDDLLLYDGHHVTTALADRLAARIAAAIMNPARGNGTDGHGARPNE